MGPRMKRLGDLSRRRRPGGRSDTTAKEGRGVAAGMQARILAAALALAGLSALSLPAHAAAASAPAPASLAFGAPGTPSFATYPLPDDIAGGPNAGEPTIGIPWDTDHLFFQANSRTYKAVFDDHGGVTWSVVTPAFTRVNVDPMLNADPVSHRIWAGGLDGPCSVMGISDDDGATWIPAGNMCNFAQLDHQSIGSGPWAASAVPRGQVYSRATYYCSQLQYTACTTSLDGGLAWLPFTEVTGGCGGLHGHIRVSEVTGFAAVPDASCATGEGTVPGVPMGSNKVGFGYTDDNGVTWKSRVVADSNSSRGFDPSLQFGRQKGWLYVGQADANGVHVAMSKDQGLTWETLGGSTPGATPAAWLDLRGAFHDPKTGAPLKYGAFADMQAGDDDRAAFSFLATTNPDGAHPFDDCGAPGDGNIWHYYVAQTFDAGQTWTVTRVSDDPVQAGAIWNGGGTQPCRNLLDFADMDVDSHGRIHIGFTDGCTKACVDKYNAWQAGQGEAPKGTDSRDRHGTVFRQVTGKGLFAKDDVAGTNATGGASGPGPSKSAKSPGLELPLLAVAVVAVAALARRRRD